jgi:hypothetical protein
MFFLVNKECPEKGNPQVAMACQSLISLFFSTMLHSIAASSTPFDKLADGTMEMIFGCLLNDSDGAIWNLSLCNKRFRRIALPLLFGNIDLDSIELVYRFFRHLVNFPHHASLVESILLCCDTEVPLGAWPPVEEQPKLERFDTLGFARAACKLGLPADLVSMVEENVHWAVSLCLLPLLPKLERLDLVCWPPINSFSVHPSKLLENRFLSSNLRQVNLEHFRIHGVMNVEVLRSLFLLPSITNIYASWFFSETDPTAGYTLIPLSAGSEYKTRESNVGTLQFDNCRMPQNILSKLLRLPKVLRKLSYTEERVKIDFINSPIEPLRQAIDYSSKTLEVLHLELHDKDLISNFPWSFSHFISLRALSVQYKLLWDQDPQHSQWLTPVP